MLYNGSCGTFSGPMRLAPASDISRSLGRLLQTQIDAVIAIGVIYHIVMRSSLGNYCVSENWADHRLHHDDYCGRPLYSKNKQIIIISFVRFINMLSLLIAHAVPISLPLILQWALWVRLNRCILLRYNRHGIAMASIACLLDSAFWLLYHRIRISKRSLIMP